MDEHHKEQLTKPNLPEYLIFKIIEYNFLDKSYRYGWRLALGTLGWKYFKHLSNLTDIFYMHDQNLVCHVTSPYCLLRQPRSIHTSLSSLNKLLRDPLSCGFLTSSSSFTEYVESLVIVENSFFSMVSIIDISDFAKQLQRIIHFHLESNFTTITSKSLAVLDSKDIRFFEYLAPKPPISSTPTPTNNSLDTSNNSDNNNSNNILISILNNKKSKLESLAFGHKTLADHDDIERIIYDEILYQHTQFQHLTSLSLQFSVSDTVTFFNALLPLQQLKALSLKCIYRSEAVARRQLNTLLMSHDQLQYLKVSFLFDNQLIATVNNRKILKQLVISPILKAAQRYAVTIDFHQLQSLKLRCAQSSHFLMTELQLSGHTNHIVRLTIDTDPVLLTVYEGTLAAFIETTSSCRYLKCYYSSRLVNSLGQNQSIECIAFKSMDTIIPFFSNCFINMISMNNTLKEIKIFDYSQPATNQQILNNTRNTVDKQSKEVTNNKFHLINLFQFKDYQCYCLEKCN